MKRFKQISFVILLFGYATRIWAASDERPNIIFLFSDDQTYVAAGCYGNVQIKTPNLDQLASEGIRFENHYNTTSICMASRTNVMTGMYEYKTGCNFLHGNLTKEKFLQSYPVLLREAGYYTGFAGKIGFELEGEEFDNFASYFDQWAGGPGQTNYETKKNEGIKEYASLYPHSSRAYGAWAVDFIKDAKSSGKPFCLSISFKAPHMPFTPDPVFDSVYDGVTFQPPANYGVENSMHLAAQSKTGRQFNSYRFWITDYNETLRTYWQLVYGVDYAIGMIREGLRTEGLDKNTVIIFTSDNGYSCGAHGFGGKVLPYEEASKSPLIICDPRLDDSLDGKSCGEVTGNVDMAPTILSLAGLPVPGHMDGLSLLPQVNAPETALRDYLPIFNFWGEYSIQEMSIVTKEWKYIYWWYGGDGMDPAEELFRIDRDSLEMANVAGDLQNAEILGRLKEYYDFQHADMKKNFAPDRDYDHYGLLMDRHLDWKTKQAYLCRISAPQ